MSIINTILLANDIHVNAILILQYSIIKILMLSPVYYCPAMILILQYSILNTAY